jgi:hypothetical protein
LAEVLSVAKETGGGLGKPFLPVLPKNIPFSLLLASGFLWWFKSNLKNMKTYTKSIALASLTLALAGPAWSADSTVAGKWQGEFDSQIGVQKYTYEFKVNGTNLTGRAIGIRDEGTNNVAIAEGKIVKDDISFVEPLKFDDNDVRIEYTGKVSGDEIKLHRKVGDFAEEDLVAKRVKKAEPKAEAKPEAKAETKPGTNSPTARP